MSIGKARVIFDNINSTDYTDYEKGAAIKVVMDMETHNSVTKAGMLDVIRYLWNMIFQMEDDGK